MLGSGQGSHRVVIERLMASAQKQASSPDLLTRVPAICLAYLHVLSDSVAPCFISRRCCVQDTHAQGGGGRGTVKFLLACALLLHRSFFLPSQLACFTVITPADTYYALHPATKCILLSLRVHHMGLHASSLLLPRCQPPSTAKVRVHTPLHLVVFGRGDLVLHFPLPALSSGAALESVMVLAFRLPIFHMPTVSRAVPSSGWTVSDPSGR